MRRFAEFAKSLHQHLRDPQQPPIAIVTSQAAHFSVRAELQLEAQRKAVRALAYYDRLAAYAIAENQIEKLGSPRLAILPSPQALTETAWRSLLNYVTQGGNLLITGPVDRDEHWHATMRAAEVKLDAHAEPLTYHNAAVSLSDRVIPLSFEQQKQDLLESLRFSDGSTFKEVSYGKGHIFWAAYPIELAEGAQAAADLYAYVSGRLGIQSTYQLKSPLPPGVLVYPMLLGDSILYVLASENADDTKVDLLDTLSGVRLTFKLRAQHAALALIGKRQGALVAKYGF
jgi:hypothetical protein